jgi:hypothetical protein
MSPVVITKYFTSIVAGKWKRTRSFALPQIEVAHFIATHGARQARSLDGGMAPALVRPPAAQVLSCRDRPRFNRT